MSGMTIKMPDLPDFLDGKQQEMVEQMRTQAIVDESDLEDYTDKEIWGALVLSKILIEQEGFPIPDAGKFKILCNAVRRHTKS